MEEIPKDPLKFPSCTKGIWKAEIHAPEALLALVMLHFFTVRDKERQTPTKMKGGRRVGTDHVLEITAKVVDYSE